MRPSSNHENIGVFAPYLLLTLVVTTIYGNIFDNVFLYDDDYLILKNTYLRDWHSLGAIFTNYVNSGAFRFGQFYRPLQNVLYLIVYQISGASLFGFHLLNIALHIANACLVYRLGRKLNFNSTATFIAALLWAVHPLHTEAVTYMSATADVLFAFFCLLGVVIIVPDFSMRRILLATPIFIFGLLSKETSMILPILVLVTFYSFSANPFSNTLQKTAALCRRLIPFWLVIGAYLLFRVMCVPFQGHAFLSPGGTSQIYSNDMLVRIWTFLATLPAYLQLLVWPVDLHMDRDFPVYLEPWHIEVGLGLVFVLLGMAHLIFRRGLKARPLNWSFLWFFAAQIPQSGILLPVNSLFLEHWMYVPSVGLFLGLAETIHLSLPPSWSRKAAVMLATFATLILAALTYNQNTIWRDPITFYRNILDHGETSVRAHNNLGIAYMNLGNYTAAMEQLQLALQSPAPVAETHQDIAALLAKNADGRSHLDEEIIEMKRALDIKPDFAPAYDGLADIYGYKGDKEQARFYRQKADLIRQKFQR